MATTPNRCVSQGSLVLDGSSRRTDSSCTIGSPTTEVDMRQLRTRTRTPRVDGTVATTVIAAATMLLAFGASPSSAAAAKAGGACTSKAVGSVVANAAGQPLVCT